MLLPGSIETGDGRQKTGDGRQKTEDYTSETEQRQDGFAVITMAKALGAGSRLGRDWQMDQPEADYTTLTSLCS